jgi:hypothetical protein
MKEVIDYLIANSPYTREELVEFNTEELSSLAYSYGYPGAPAPKIVV